MTRKQLVYFGILLLAFPVLVYAMGLNLGTILPGVSGSFNVFGFLISGTDVVLLIFVAFGIFVLALTRIRKNLKG